MKLNSLIYDIKYVPWGIAGDNIRPNTRLISRDKVFIVSMSVSLILDEVRIALLDLW